MNKLPNFNIETKGEISLEFLKRNMLTFHQAITYIQKLPYGRNADKDNLSTVFIDNKGTCSTKHALLKQVADENNFNEMQLILGIFRMNAQNTFKIAKTLKEYNLEYIPEAHNYLKYKGKIFDFTRMNSSATDFATDLVYEIDIKPSEINQTKIQIHKNFLIDWLNENPNITYSLNEIWSIREQCIKDLSE
ncbi:hypothetical protein H1R17_12120 [Flavobacterium sp. xlx-214]|uniref:hypothetical protein n=1 Tax=unclassified Flavobacterium TaxID=196869 RepID=UPI0013D53A30|nr:MULTISPECIES: hypothetical protein [unclassified Flavobacterium]MBA5793786.1 hypothetical protein [Flavobacterium sp. xlx-221]QMI83194.1 hypothetical protein H1R17_12120 [Flavobacterium sp. xlx-214]